MRMNQTLLAGVRFLVVDDDGPTLVMLQNMLVMFGAEVETAPSASRALMLLGRRKDAQRLPHIAIIDWHMPPYGGEVLARTMRDTPDYVPILRVSWSAVANNEDRYWTIEQEIFNILLAKGLTSAQFADRVLSELTSRQLI